MSKQRFMFTFNITCAFLSLTKFVKNQTADDTTMPRTVSCKERAGSTWKALEAVEAFLVSYQKLKDLSGSSSSSRC